MISTLRAIGPVSLCLPSRISLILECLKLFKGLLFWLLHICFQVGHKAAIWTQKVGVIRPMNEAPYAFVVPDVTAWRHK